MNDIIKDDFHYGTIERQEGTTYSARANGWHGNVNFPSRQSATDYCIRKGDPIPCPPSYLIHDPRRSSAFSA